MIVSSTEDIDLKIMSNDKFKKGEFLFLGLLVPPDPKVKYDPIKLKTEVNGIKYKHNCS